METGQSVASTFAGTAGTDEGKSRDALGYLQSVYNNPMQPDRVRLKAAEIALPFEKPKLAVIAQLGGEHDLGERLTRAIEASNAVLAQREMKVIEATPVEAAQVESPDHSAPFPQNNKSRFRRF